MAHPSLPSAGGTGDGNEWEEDDVTEGSESESAIPPIS